MNFEFSDTQTMLIDSASRLMRDHSGVEHWRNRRAFEDGCDPAMWSRFAEMGWLALAVPEDAGGLGGSMEDVALLMIELGRSLAQEPIVTSAILCAHLIERLGAGERREALLSAMSAGEQRFALAHDEAGDRYELDLPRTTVARRDGADYVISGAKLMAIDAPSAGILLVTATLESERPFGIFLVPVEAVGVSVAGYPLVDGTRAADIDLVDVRLPEDSLLGAGASAVEALRAAVDRASAALIAQAVGAMEAAVTLTSDYAKERRQFGQPIGKFQAIQHLAADMFVAAYQARSALYQLLAHQDGDDRERSRALAIARLMVAEAGKTVGHNGIQIHGGYGMTDEYAISHYWRRLYSLERQYGDAEHYLEQLSAAGAADAVE